MIERISFQNTHCLRNVQWNSGLPHVDEERRLAANTNLRFIGKDGLTFFGDAGRVFLAGEVRVYVMSGFGF